MDWNDPETWRAWREGRISWEEVAADDAQRHSAVRERQPEERKKNARLRALVDKLSQKK